MLTSGGHNAGIVSEPGHKNRAYRVATAKDDDPYIDPGYMAATEQAGAGVLVAGVGEVAQGRIEAEFAAPPPTRRPRGRL